jgi:hypothetical protein
MPFLDLELLPDRLLGFLWILRDLFEPFGSSFLAIAFLETTTIRAALSKSVQNAEIVLRQGSELFQCYIAAEDGICECRISRKK